MMIFSLFRKIETKNLNLDPRILIFVVLETTSPAAHWLSKVVINKIEATIRGHSQVSLKLAEDFNILYRKQTIRN